MFCLIAVVLVLGGTFAYWTWVSTEDKDVVFSTNGIEGYIVYDEGDSHFVGDFQPSDTFCESVSTTVSVYKLKEIDENIAKNKEIITLLEEKKAALARLEEAKNASAYSYLATMAAADPTSSEEPETIAISASDDAVLLKDKKEEAKATNTKQQQPIM